MINFKHAFLGDSDANKEAEKSPNNFMQVFFDPENHIDELVDRDKYILSGRKGDGKSAYGAQIRLTAEKRGVWVHSDSLDCFNDAVFQQIETAATVGGNPYTAFWKCILLIKYVGMIYECNPNIQDPCFAELVYALTQRGFLSADNSVSITVDKLVESDSSIVLRPVQFNKKTQREEVLRGADQIYRAIRGTIKSLYLDTRFVYLLDGLDDLLQYSKFNPDIMTGLIRAADEINGFFKSTTLKVKCIIFIRNDMLALCRDPNINKIKRDSTIVLSWKLLKDTFKSNLLQLVEKRIRLSSDEDVTISDFWNAVFPEKIDGKPSVDYILDNIIYRPRDILQLLIEMQKLYVVGMRLTEGDISDALTQYSNDYFVGAMQDDMTGFFPNDVVTILPEVFSRMRKQYFYLDDFKIVCKKYRELSDIEPELILKKLFDAGYIGQYRPRDVNSTPPVFSYRNPLEKFDSEHKCILHRGLCRALTV